MIRLGILGTARIARMLFERPLRNVRVVAVGSREQARAATYASEYGIPHAYGSYKELLLSAAIDAVYIPLPHHLHCTYAMLAAEHKKHVLVEKPAALSPSEFRKMHRSCQRHGVLLMEGMMYRFTRVHQRARELVRDGVIGTLRYIDFNWCINAVRIGRAGFRLDPACGGGALRDLGIYGLDFLRFISPSSQPKLLGAWIRRQDPNGIDEFTHALLLTGGAAASVTCAYNTDANYYTISGDEGAIHAPLGLSGRPIENRLQLHLLKGDMRYEEIFAPENPYILEVEHFARCIENGETPLMPEDDTIQNLSLLNIILDRGVRLRA